MVPYAPTVRKQGRICRSDASLRTYGAQAGARTGPIGPAPSVRPRYRIRRSVIARYRIRRPVILQLGYCNRDRNCCMRSTASLI
jgi:hypothetical protein